MQKIPTMFERDETVKGHPVTNVIKPECQWVLDGEGIATEKRDGTNVKVEGRQLYKRQKPKERDYDNAAYVLCDRNDPSDRWAFEGYDYMEQPVPDGIYELVGPKVQGNPHKYTTHALIRVVPPSATLKPVFGDPPRTFEGLREYLSRVPTEGIVFHHPDGRMAKIKRRDFGLPWPVQKESA